MSKRAWFIVALLSWPCRLHAAGVSYVHATSQYQEKENHSRFHPLNLFDDDPETIWCTDAATPENETIELVFKRRQRIDRVTVNPTTKSGRVVRSIRISDGQSRVTVNVGTAPAAEVFSKALDGTHYTVEIASLGEPVGETAVSKDAVCLADVVLYLRDSYMGGAASKLRYDTNLEQLVGAWNGGALGAPEQTLVFSLDGGWEWKHTPLLGGKAKRLAGEFRFRGDRLLMRTGEVGRWVDMQYKRRRVTVDRDEMGAANADYDLIVLGRGLSPELAGEYNNARFE